VLTALLSCSQLRRAGGFDSTLRDGCEDYDLWLRLAAEQVPFDYLDEPLAVYRMHEGAMSRDAVAMTTARLTVLERAAERATGDVRTRFERRAALERRAVASALRGRAWRHVNEEEIDAARSDLRAADEIAPSVMGSLGTAVAARSERALRLLARRRGPAPVRATDARARRSTGRAEPGGAPRVSVVIPTYNRADLLPAAIESVLEQTFADLEVIVADDGSEDETAELVRGHADPRVTFVPLAHSGSLGAVRNAGIGHARGELIAFLDSDDLWREDKLRRQVAVLDERPDVALASTNAEVIDGNGADLGRTYLGDSQEPAVSSLDSLLADNFVIVSTAVVRRSILERVGRFAEEPLLRGVEDYDLWLRVAAVSEVVYLPEPLALYREHDASMRREVAPATYWRSLLRILARFSQFADAQKLEVPYALVRSREGACRIALAQSLQSENGLLHALPRWADAVRRHPYSATRSLLASGRTRR
jgi:GT2 family glycosyltransferase